MRYHKTMGEICLKRASNPEKYFFMGVQDNGRRMGFVKHTIPDASDILKEYGNDPVIAVSGYFVHQAIAHFEVTKDMYSWGRANHVRTEKNIAYNNELIMKHKRILIDIQPDFARKMLESLKGLEARI